MDRSVETGLPQGFGIEAFVGSNVKYANPTEAAQDRLAVYRKRNTPMYIPVGPCEELLNNQFEPSTHPRDLTDSTNGDLDSYIVVMATHNRTTEGVSTLQAVSNYAAETAVLLDSYVFVDEPPADGERTEEVLSGLDRPPRILRGNGTSYWSRSLHALLDEALRSNVDYIVHVNTDVTITASIDVLLELMRSDTRVAATVGVLSGKVPITGYRCVHPWFPFFRSVQPGNDASIVPASYIVYRASALRSSRIDLPALGEYRHGWADVELSLQLRAAGFRLATSPVVVGVVQHERYYQRKHHFERYDGSLVRYIRDCPTAPCFADTRRIGTRLFGRFWPVLLRIYVPVIWHWMRYRTRRVWSPAAKSEGR